MKKETIEKLFKRYVNIFNSVVTNETNEPLDETLIKSIESQVDLLFKDYEHIDTINDFTQFSNRIKDIVETVIDTSKNINAIQYKKIADETFCKFKINPIEYIDGMLSKMEEMTLQDNDHFYIPADPNFNRIASQGGFKEWNIKFNVNKNLSASESSYNKIHVGYNAYNETPETIEEDAKRFYDIANDYPMQFTSDTLAKYFPLNRHHDLYEKFMAFTNSDKNQIMMNLMCHLQENHIEKDEDYLTELLYKYEPCTYPVNYKLLSKNVHTKISEMFAGSLYSRIQIVEKFSKGWHFLLNSTLLTSAQKKDLNKKYRTLNKEFDKLTDASLIRFYNLMNNITGGSYKFVEMQKENVNQFAVYQQLNIEFLILLNEIETVKYQDNTIVLNGSILDKLELDEIQKDILYINMANPNIINSFYKIIDDNEIKHVFNKNAVYDQIEILCQLISIYDKKFKLKKYKKILDLYTNLKLKISSIKHALKQIKHTKK